MTAQRRPERFRRAIGSLRGAPLAGGMILIATCIVAILMLVLDVRTQLAALERANSDNSQWVVTQTEVEVLRLQVAVEHALGTPPEERVRSLAEVRRWFNVLYSRVSILEDSAIYGPLLDAAPLAENRDAIRQFLDARVPAIDGPDTALAAALPRMAAELQSVRQAARAMTLDALSKFAEESDLQRTSMSETLVRLAVLTGALVVVLGALAIGMSRLYSISVSRADSLAKTGSRLSTIVSNSADGIVVTDHDGVIEEFNPAAQALFGCARDQVIGQNALSLFLSEDGTERHRLLAALDATTASDGSPLRIELDALRPDGSHFPAEVSIARTNLSREPRVVAFIRDISERRAAQEQIEAALERAVSGEKAKAEFLAVMSHEMRTPLNGLIGSMAILGDSALDDDQRELLRVMQTSGDILLGHVNSVLDISRAEAGAMQIVEQIFDADSLIDDAVANQTGLAAAGGNVIEVVQVTGPLGHVRGDAGRLRQILLNLIGNAVKFTKNGTITVETERLSGPSGDPDADEVEIRVIDTGIGISEENLGRIFEDFVTLDASYMRAAGGTGLGLGIARRLAEAMGGSIGAESEEGEGSLFWLRLALPADEPIAAGAEQAALRTEAASPPDPVPDDMAPLDILVVEDNEINRFLLRRYLESGNHRMTEAVDGLEGVERAGAQRFDIILMDISMPRLDGVEAARRIRQGGGPSAKARILALTAHALPEEQEKFRAAGMDACLTKPIARDDLLAALAGAVPVAAPATDAAPLVDRKSIDDLAGQIGARTAADLLSRLMTEGDEKVALSLRLHAAGEDADVARHCHQLAGTCGTFGTRRLRQTLAEIEVSVARGQSDRLAELVAALPALWKATRIELAEIATSLDRAA